MERESQEQKQLIRNIKAHEIEIDSIFKNLEIKESKIKKEGPQNNGQLTPQSQSSYFNNLSIKDIRKNYNQSFFLTKFLALPMCKKTIVQKIKFLIPTSFLFYITFIYWRKMGNQALSWGWKKHTARLSCLTLGLISFGVIETIYTSPYCDINSLHYAENISHLERARQIKMHYKEHYVQNKQNLA